MVREKMLRVLADVADFEEVAEEFERTMQHGVAAAAAAAEHDTPSTAGNIPRDDDSHIIPERLSGEPITPILLHSARTLIRPVHPHTLCDSFCVYTAHHLTFLVRSYSEYLSKAADFNLSTCIWRVPVRFLPRSFV